MRKSFFKVLVMVILLLAVFSVESFAEEFVAKRIIVTGYQPEQYSVSGDVKINLDKEIKVMDADLKEFSKVLACLVLDCKLSVNIVGHADNTGDFSRNEDIGGKRAEQGKKHIESIFPKGKVEINHRSGGDEKNMRSIVIEYSPVKRFGVKAGMCSLGIFVFVLIVSFAISSRSVKKANEELNNTIKSEAKKASKGVVKRVDVKLPERVEVTVDNMIYLVDIFYDHSERKLYSPFVDPKQGNRFYVKLSKNVLADINEMRGSIKRCIKRSKKEEALKEQLQELFKTKKIKAKNKTKQSKGVKS